LQIPSASAYVTYSKADEALRAIQTVNNFQVDNRTLKASLGTTKYCSHFLKSTHCPKVDCMYLHELGEDAASFTKEDMSQGYASNSSMVYLTLGNNFSLVVFQVNTWNMKRNSSSTYCTYRDKVKTWQRIQTLLQSQTVTYPVLSLH
jgi:hypothetical protein